MLINSDFSRRAVVTPEGYHWVASPQAGVSRVMLDRVGGEVARATSVVRYAQGSRFPTHRHPGGEEILVLSGTFSDESGDFPAGWYLRNPPGSSHAPSSEPGAIIFVKLYQMTERERETVRIDTRAPNRWSSLGSREVCALFEDDVERVVLARVPAGERVRSAVPCRTELFVVEGELVADGAVYGKGSWLRLPPGDSLALNAGAAGATLYLKTVRSRATEQPR